jgi:hypothetical protein
MKSITAKDREIKRKLMIPKHAEETKHAGRTSRYCSIGRAIFYYWKAALEKYGEATLVRKKPVKSNSLAGEIQFAAGTGGIPSEPGYAFQTIATIQPDSDANERCLGNPCAGDRSNGS